MPQMSTDARHRHMAQTHGADAGTKNPTNIFENLVKIKNQ